jgi:post-segregation antitoxin (ccd killing protein)
MVRRMPRVQVYLPDDLHDELKRRGLPASELLQIALRAEVERQHALDATASYLEELAGDVGEPGPRQRATADAVARRIRERAFGKVG